MSGARFLVGNFTGRGGESASSWLKKVKYELQNITGEGQTPPKEYLRAIEFLLTEDAEEWVESHREASSLLAL